MKAIKISIIGILALSLVSTSCKKQKSATTGWNLNDPKWGGFQRYDYKGQETGPGMVLVPGGTFTMGSQEQDVLYDNNNLERRVTVPSFYIDETEISNFQYLEYLYWLQRTYVDVPQVHAAALPDTLSWRNKLAYNEPYVTNYLRHPSYQDYPVVGVSWIQASRYCDWRTDRVNEMILIREGIMKPDPDQSNENVFNTEAYLQGQYEGAIREKGQLKDLDPHGSGTRKVRIEDGIFLPDYRLPTEAEWEYAAGAMSGNANKGEENINTRRVYPWNGLTVRAEYPEKHRGEIMANFKRGRGDNAGIASKLNDNGFITTPVKSNFPNDFGLYNMAGNVSEWVMDVYRPLTGEDVTDFRAFRGNVYRTKQLDPDGYVMEKDSLGRIKYRDVTVEENQNRHNYKKSDNIGYLDEESYQNDEQKYDYGNATLINNKARVFKGGSWNDRAYWLTPGTRRFLDENQSLSTLGFRCCMERLGGAAGNNQKKKKGSGY
jgi:sulfatase modifying factor 1